MSDKQIPALVRGLRQQLGLTQEQLAQRLGVTYSTVNQWENGKRAPHPYLESRLLELRADLDGADLGVTAPRRGGHAGRPRRQIRAGSSLPLRSARVDSEIVSMMGLIVTRFRPHRVILFGSHARGEAGPESDVDLLVVMDVPGSKREAQLTVRRALRDFPIPKDVIVVTPEEYEWRKQVPGTIERAAAREGEVLYART